MTIKFVLFDLNTNGYLAYNKKSGQFSITKKWQESLILNSAEQCESYLLNSPKSKDIKKISKHWATRKFYELD